MIAVGLLNLTHKVVLGLMAAFWHYFGLLCIYCYSFLSICSWIFARKWPNILQGPQLHLLCGFLNLSAWIVVVSPILVLIIWGSWLIVLGRDLIGLAVIMAGTALLLAFYSIMLWWRTQWQSSSKYFLAYYYLLFTVIKFYIFYSIWNSHF